MEKETIDVYSLNEVADILQITRRTLYNWIKENKIQAFKVGKEWRISKEALREFMEHGTQS